MHLILDFVRERIEIGESPPSSGLVKNQKSGLARAHFLNVKSQVSKKSLYNLEYSRWPTVTWPTKTLCNRKNFISFFAFTAENPSCLRHIWDKTPLLSLMVMFVGKILLHQENLSWFPFSRILTFSLGARVFFLPISLALTRASNQNHEARLVSFCRNSTNRLCRWQWYQTYNGQCDGKKVHVRDESHQKEGRFE